MGERLHPAFPETPVGAGLWDMPDPLGDIDSACDVAQGHGLNFRDLASVTDYYIESNEGVWSPGGQIGTELALVLVGTLRDGRWFGIEAWNDYTGWGCQDGSDAYIGDTKDDVVRNGLTVEGRNHLGLEVA